MGSGHRLLLGESDQVPRNPAISIPPLQEILFFSSEGLPTRLPSAEGCQRPVDLFLCVVKVGDMHRRPSASRQRSGRAWRDLFVSHPRLLGLYRPVFLSGARVFSRCARVSTACAGLCGSRKCPHRPGKACANRVNTRAQREHSCAPAANKWPPAARRKQRGRGRKWQPQTRGQQVRTLARHVQTLQHRVKPNNDGQTPPGGGLKANPLRARYTGGASSVASAPGFSSRARSAGRPRPRMLT